MEIYGDPGTYSIMVMDDSHPFDIVFYYYQNDEDPTEELVAIAGHYFQRHVVCRDFPLVNIVKRFFETGERLDTVKWKKPQRMVEVDPSFRTTG